MTEDAPVQDTPQTETAPEPKRLLICSEAPYVATGYGRVIAQLFSEMPGWEVHVMGWQYHGMSMKLGNFIYHDPGLDSMQSSNFPGNIEAVLAKVNPDIVFSLIDIWYTTKIAAVCRQRKIPYVNYFPIDSSPIPGKWLQSMYYSSYPVTMSNFGAKTIMQAAKRYLKKEQWDEFKMPVVYHGVDGEIYNVSKERRETARAMYKEMIEKLGYNTKEEPFIVFIGNRNVDRKNIPATLEAIAKFAEEKNNVFIAMKVGMLYDVHNGHHLGDVIDKFRLNDRVLLLDQSENPLDGVSEEEIALYLSGADVYISLTMGEGFGLWTGQAMACGLPVILADNTTAPELLGDGERGWLVSCTTHIYSKHNTHFMVADIEHAVGQLEYVYEHPDEARAKTELAAEWMKNLDWKLIRKQFIDIFEVAMRDGVKPRLMEQKAKASTENTKIETIDE